MAKDKKFLEEMIKSEGFYEVAKGVFGSLGVVMPDDLPVPEFVYNDEDQCFYSTSRVSYWLTTDCDADELDEYSVKLTAEDLPDGGPGDIKFDFTFGDFEQPEEMKGWKKALLFETILYKSGKYIAEQDLMDTAVKQEEIRKVTKDKEYLEDLIHSISFDTKLKKTLSLFSELSDLDQVEFSDYNEEDQCFYSLSRHMYKGNQFLMKITAEELSDGGPDDIAFNIWLGDFKQPEAKKDWEDFYNVITAVIYEDGQLKSILDISAQ
ncbi:MAG: hypothetical protein J6Z43_09920 [Clostridiales bacterium]|nr:hypothetical protein [Clostridiales bacterium]